MMGFYMDNGRKKPNDINIISKPEAGFWVYGSVVGLLMFSFSVQADSMKLSESQTEKVKCITTKVDGEKNTECSKITTGKFLITAKISASTFEEYGIVFSNITEETPLAINIGSYQFSDTLSSDEKHVLKTRSLKGAWYSTHEDCKTKKVKVDGEWVEQEVCKDVKHTTTKVSASASFGATITVSGDRSSSGDYGDAVFTQICIEEGSGSHEVLASISIGDITIESNIAVKCNGKTNFQKKNEEVYELYNMDITAKLCGRKEYISGICI